MVHYLSKLSAAYYEKYLTPYCFSIESPFQLRERLRNKFWEFVSLEQIKILREGAMLADRWTMVYPCLLLNDKVISMGQRSNIFTLMHFLNSYGLTNKAAIEVHDSPTLLFFTR